MKSSDDLFQLVKSLSKSEKRYFKLHAVKEPDAGAKDNYLPLFDGLDKMDVYEQA
jgi:hypothetical protein